MKFLSGLFGGNSKPKPQARPVSGIDVDEDWNASSAPAENPEDAFDARLSAMAGAPAMPEPIEEDEFEADDVGTLDIETMENVLETAGKPRAKRTSQINIWDLEEDDEAPAAATAPAPAPAPEASSRKRRNRTRLIGFDTSQGDVVDLFDEAPKAAPSEQTMFPVGWILVVDGPGRGHCFSLVAGMSQIGRGEDQPIKLDFGDNAISRNNHAAIVYDPEQRSFLLGHGGKANIVRLNGKPVISTESVTDGDKIQLGETTLQLKTLCGPDFDWSDTDGDEEQEDVAIA